MEKANLDTLLGNLFSQITLPTPPTPPPPPFIPGLSPENYNEQGNTTKVPGKQDVFTTTTEEPMSAEDRALLAQFGHIEDVLKPNDEPKHVIHRVYAVGESNGEGVGPSEEMGVAA